MPTSYNKRILMRLNTASLDETTKQTLKEQLKEIAGETPTEDGAHTDVHVPVNKLSVLNKTLKKQGLRPRLHAERRQTSPEPRDLPAQLPGQKPLSILELPRQQKAASERYQVNNAGFNLPGHLLDFQLEARHRWWQPTPKKYERYQPGEVDVLERDITLLNGQQVTFIRRSDQHPETGLPRKQFFLRDKRHQLVNADDISPELLPLYGVDKLKKNGPVVLCEGIKATDALIEQKVNALGTLTGALSMPSLAALAVLMERDVLLWPDNDDLGLAHMAAIATELHQRGIQTRVIQWQQGPHKGDAADYVAEKQDVDKLIEHAAPWDPELLQKAARPPRLRPQVSPLSLRNPQPGDVETRTLSAWPS